MAQPMLLTLIASLLISGIGGEFVNTFVDRRVNLESQLVKVRTTITFVDHGSDRDGYYKYLIAEDAGHFYVRFTDKAGAILKHEPASSDNKTVHVFLPHVGDRNVFVVEEVHMEKLHVLGRFKPFKKHDYLRYSGNYYYYSCYKTLKFHVKYIVDRDYYVNIQPHNVRNYTSEYFLNTPFKPFSFDTIEFEIVTNRPLIHVVHLERTIDVSHYGKIRVHESINLKNNAAKVIGSYKPVVKEWLYTFLPSSANDVQISDVLGLRYNWNVIPHDNYISIKFQTRFPLLGGWKDSYDLSYSVPSYEYLYVTGKDRYLLKMRLFDHVLNDAIIDEFVTRIVLPENSFDVMVSGEIKEQKVEDSLAALSCYGRKTVVFEGAHKIENQIADFTIEYSQHWSNMLRVPFKLAAWLYIVFICIVFFIRFSEWFSLK